MHSTELQRALYFYFKNGGDIDHFIDLIPEQHMFTVGFFVCACNILRMCGWSTLNRPLRVSFDDPFEGEIVFNARQRLISLKKQKGVPTIDDLKFYGMATHSPNARRCRDLLFHAEHMFRRLGAHALAVKVLDGVVALNSVRIFIEENNLATFADPCESITTVIGSATFSNMLRADTRAYTIAVMMDIYATFYHGRPAMVYPPPAKRPHMARSTCSQSAKQATTGPENSCALSSRAAVE